MSDSRRHPSSASDASALAFALYHELTPWYRLLDPAEDHRDEADAYTDALLRGLDEKRARSTLAKLPDEARPTLLELGAGAGHNALHMKKYFRCTLSDLSPAMRALSRDLNPDCEHVDVDGDMRTLRLAVDASALHGEQGAKLRTFDCVFIHDAITYMTNEADLRAALTTAWLHTKPGGAALFAPDCYKESFVEVSELHSVDRDGRSLRCLEWIWDPNPDDDTYSVEYVMTMRESPTDTTVRVARDSHVEGLFTRARWTELLEDVGYVVERATRPVDDEGAVDDVFLCRRPRN